MKDFIALFIVCFVICLIVIFFTGGIIFTNIWAIIALISMILAIIAKNFINQSDKIEELEKKIEQLLKDEQNDEGT
ncbi:hypothetical protein [Sedimentibacter sp.]|uniref:hypothetical protein n=1 Tax=Sedimentibacter sp. TaxID=1960295 RepID=UPI0028A6C754|nr:hypothetical protein [Sedimentibacter sp.]